ncbi:beta-ketoacyl-ACP synthase III [Stackebrandtia nassauensis]|uniref:Beta-ketoacyl-[acyl-carrier-protein] synthase III n=1 Tax=Stackebrandtia nassauensis (strain DSM 44728 / CIP 108903 / NRRL B-16338 / NBRC 102104 / LLR-40K-21) TaxID=446470 RepID=D3Q8K8_STANL|nr:beta-ketoacyl-ACP synthase III [Stackebrandtia nassauensis]ADD44450.1 3-oxoacyl-(acyl-carrier-protein) synthase III [Stackebrandtia nassauensis DSM 44728]
MSSKGSRVLGLGHYQPSKVLTNEDLSKIVDTNDEWIQSRVGIKERRIAEKESVADMATEAAAKALTDAGLTAADIDLVVVATCSNIDRVPNTACRVADRLGIEAPGAFDVNTACSGFSHALATADHAIRAGASTTALVIGVEKLSDFTDWTDRSTCVIFGDGAGAAVITGTNDAKPGVGPVVWGSVPSMSDVVRIEATHPYIAQEGQTVFRWAITTLAPLARKAAEAAGVAMEDVAAFVGHQANLRIIEGIAKKLQAPNAIIATDIIESGNTSAASVPLALSKMVERGELTSGAPVLLFGFGGGLTYAGQIIYVP